jgi:hypothetical protein
MAALKARLLAGQVDAQKKLLQRLSAEKDTLTPEDKQALMLRLSKLSGEINKARSAGTGSPAPTPAPAAPAAAAPAPKLTAMEAIARLKAKQAAEAAAAAEAANQ